MFELHTDTCVVVLCCCLVLFCGVVLCCCVVLCGVVCPVSELSVPVPWGEIRGKVWGPDQGRPVLCLHGWADNCGSFNTLIPLLPKGKS